MVPRSAFALRLAVACALLALVGAVDQTVDPELVRSLKLSATGLDRGKLLPKDDDWKFDYFRHDFHSYRPGGVVNANAATFPATVGNGMTMAWISLGPCAVLPPHFHPRASNYVVSVEGTTETFMVLENGARLVRTVLAPGQMTLFPTGSMHAMQNTGELQLFLLARAGSMSLTNCRMRQRDADIGAELGGRGHAQHGEQPVQPTASHARRRVRQQSHGGPVRQPGAGHTGLWHRGVRRVRGVPEKMRDGAVDVGTGGVGGPEHESTRQMLIAPTQERRTRPAGRGLDGRRGLARGG